MLKGFWQKNAWRYLPGSILLILCAWIQTRSPLALGRAIELSVSGDWIAFSREAWLILVIAMGVFVTRFGWRYFIIGMSREMEIHLRDRLYEHFMFLPVSFYGKHRSGDLMAYAVNDVGSVRQMFGVVVAQILNAVSSIIFSVGEMAAGVNSNLTIIALLPIPLAVVLVIVIGRKIQTRSRRVQELFATVSGHVQENINGMRVLKAFALEKAQYEAYEQESLEKKEANRRLYNTGALLNPVIQMIFGLSYMVGLVYGGQLVLEGSISLGDYVAFNSYLTLIVFPVMATGRVANMLQRGMASYKRLKTIMNQPETAEFERQADGCIIQGALKADHLTYTYEGGASPALSDVSFSLPAGKVLGLAGPTGCGKSTIMMLLTKLLLPSRGGLQVDGRDILDIPAATIRAQTGYVPQDGFLFNESIRNNIDFFLGADDTKITAALHIAGLENDIAHMPDGLATKAGERGNHLSGGQRQRVSLARALIREPRVLLLDDTLSAVDAHTEGQILAALKETLNGRTAVIVAHRLSALRCADEILYLEKGRVVERGTHQQLLRQNGAYARVYRNQEQEASAR